MKRSSRAFRETIESPSSRRLRALTRSGACSGQLAGGGESGVRLASDQAPATASAQFPNRHDDHQQWVAPELGEFVRMRLEQGLNLEVLTAIAAEQDATLDSVVDIARRKRAERTAANHRGAGTGAGTARGTGAGGGRGVVRMRRSGFIACSCAPQ